MARIAWSLVNWTALNPVWRLHWPPVASGFSAGSKHRYGLLNRGICCLDSRVDNRYAPFSPNRGNTRNPRNTRTLVCYRAGCRDNLFPLVRLARLPRALDRSEALLPKSGFLVDYCDVTRVAGRDRLRLLRFDPKDRCSRIIIALPAAEAFAFLALGLLGVDRLSSGLPVFD